MNKIVVGFEAGEERRGNLKIGDLYIAVDRGFRSEEDREYVARWDGFRPVPVK
jgi:hypothetical protein